MPKPLLAYYKIESVKQHDLYSWSATRLKLSHEAMTDYGILNAAAHKLEEL